MVAGGPRQWFATEVHQREFARQSHGLEAISDGEFVIVRVSLPRLVAGKKLRDEAARVGVDDFEVTLAGEAVHWHRAAHPVGRTPEMNVAVIEDAGVERKQ